MDIRKILFVTRFETLWFDAVESLMDLRKASLDHVVFLNVIERDNVALRRGKGYQKNEEVRLREMANIRFINWAETLFERGLEVGAYIVVGSLVKQVIVAVKKETIDLVVVGHEKKRSYPTVVFIFGYPGNYSPIPDTGIGIQVQVRQHHRR